MYINCGARQAAGETVSGLFTPTVTAVFISVCTALAHGSHLMTERTSRWQSAV